MSPIELLLHVTLPLIPILAIAVVTLNTLQTNTIRDIQGALVDYDVDDMYDLVIEIQRQELMIRYELVLDAWEAKLCLGAFPIDEGAEATPDGQQAEEPTLAEIFVVGKEGFPRDPRFRILCSKANESLGSTSVKILVTDFYKEALALEIVKDGKKIKKTLWDSRHRRMPARLRGTGVRPVTEKNREWALDRITERVEKAHRRVNNIQLAAVQAVYEASAKNADSEFAAASEDEVEKKILQAFRGRTIPLLPGLFDK